MIDPFRSELTVGYLERENLEWAARERLIRSIKPRRAGLGFLARIASLLAGEAPVQPRPELQGLQSTRRTAA